MPDSPPGDLPPKEPPPPNPPPPPGDEPPPVVERAGRFVLWAIVFVALVGLLGLAARWESAALVLLGLVGIAACIALLLWPQRTSAWKWFTTTPVAILSAILTISGAGGGFAFHLVKHHGAIVLIGFRHVAADDSEPPVRSAAATATPTPTATPTAPPGKVGTGMTPDVTSASASPTASGAPGADASPAKATAGESIGPNTKADTRLVFDFGFLADVFIGLIAANALHLAISGIVKYDDADREGKNNVYYTLIALGILAGFSGAKVLPSFAQRILTLEEQTRQVAQELKKDPNVAAEIVNNPNTQQAIKDTATQSLKADSKAAAAIVQKAAQDPKVKETIREVASESPSPTSSPTPTATVSPTPTPEG